MKIGGEEIYPYCGEHVIFRKDDDGNPVPKYRFPIKALSSRWDIEASRQIQYPKAPTANEKVKNSETGAWELKKLTDSPEHREAVANWQRAMNAKRIYDGTDPDAVEFAADVALLEKNPRAFYEAVADELDTAVGAGEVMHWANAIIGISQVGGYDVLQSEARMFPVQTGIEELQAGDQEQDGD